MMSASDLTYVRTQAEEALPVTVTIQTMQRTADGYGGFTEAWAESYEDVPARLSPLSGRDAEWAARRAVEASWMLTVSRAQELSASDRMSYQGHVYAVLFVEDDGSYQTAKRALLKRLE